MSNEAETRFWMNFSRYTHPHRAEAVRTLRAAGEPALADAVDGDMNDWIEPDDRAVIHAHLGRAIAGDTGHPIVEIDLDDHLSWIELVSEILEDWAEWELASRTRGVLSCDDDDDGVTLYTKPEKELVQLAIAFAREQGSLRIEKTTTGFVCRHPLGILFEAETAEDLAEQLNDSMISDSTLCELRMSLDGLDDVWDHREPERHALVVEEIIDNGVHRGWEACVEAHAGRRVKSAAFKYYPNAPTAVDIGALLDSATALPEVLRMKLFGEFIAVPRPRRAVYMRLVDHPIYLRAQEASLKVRLRAFGETLNTAMRVHEEDRWTAGELRFMEGRLMHEMGDTELSPYRRL